MMPNISAPIPITDSRLPTGSRFESWGSKVSGTNSSVIRAITTQSAAVPAKIDPNQNDSMSAPAPSAPRFLTAVDTACAFNATDSPEVVAYHPRATIVIGRSHDWPKEQQRALHGLNRRLADISVISYDHLLAQARATLDLVEAPEPEAEVIVPAGTEWDFDDEPF